MASRRRRRTRGQNRADGGRASAPDRTKRANDGADGKRGDGAKKSKGGARKGGFGRGFWIYMVAMMAVLIPLNLVCLNQANAPGPGEAAEVQTAPVLESINEPHAPYATDPPTSGPHVAELAPHGYRSDTLPDEIQVANLASGFVIVHYNPAATALLPADMQQLAAEFEGHDLIVQPDGSLPAATAVALTAWGRIEQLETYDRGRVYNFVRSYAGVGQTTPPAAAAGGS